MITLKTCGNNSKLLFTDTDSLMQEVKTEDEDDHEDFSSDKEIFRFSNYSTKSKYFDDSNKLVIGQMADESGSVAIEEIVETLMKMERQNLFLNATKINKCVIKLLIITLMH